MSSVQEIGQQSQVSDRAGEPRGIGGWLLLVAVLEGAVLLKLFVVLGQYYQDPEIQSAFRQFPLAACGELALNLLVVLLAISTTILLFLRSPRFPRFFVCQLVVTLVIPIISTAWTAFALSSQLAEPLHDLFAFEPSDWLQLAIAAVVALIGIPYVLRSRRVRNTFDGHDHAQRTKLLIVIVFVVAASGAVAVLAGLLHAAVRGTFSGQLLGGPLQIALAVWLYRGSNIARSVLILLYAFGFLFSIGLAFFSSGGGSMIVVLGSIMSVVAAVVFWILAFSKRFRAELEINEARYRKPDVETA